MNSLSVGKVIDLLSSDHSREVEALKEIVANVEKIEASIPALRDNMDKSFKHVIDSFKDSGVTFDGMYFSLEDMDAALRELNDRYADAERRFEAARRDYIQYNDVNYEPQLNTIERNRLLAAKKVAWDSLKIEKENAWKALNDMQETAGNNADFASFEHAASVYAAKKDEMLSKLDAIKDDSLRIDVETEIDKIGKLVASIKEKEQAKAAEIAKINGIAETLGVDIVYETTKTQVVSKEAKKEIVTEEVKVEEPILPEADEVSKVFEGDLSEFAKSFDETTAPIIEETEPQFAPELTPVVEDVPVATNGERYTVKKTASAIIDEPAKALFGAAGIISKASETDKVETVDGIRDGLKSLYGKVVGDSQERVTEIEANVDRPLTKESSEELITGIEKCIKYYPKYKKEAAERRTAPVPDMAPGLEDDIQKSFESMDSNLNDLKSIDDILNGSRGM